MRETETTVNTMPSSNTPNLFQLISGYKPHATKPPNLPKMVPESEPANIRVTDIAGHMEPTSDTPSMFRTISGSKLQDLDTPNEFSLITESVPAKMRVTEDTADNAVPTSDTENVFTFPLSHELLVTDAINPIPEPQQTKISNTEVADNVVSTSCTPKVFALIPDHDLMITASPHVISPIPETEPAKIRDTEVAVHEVSISDVFNLIPDSDPPATEIPNKINPTPKSGEIGDVKVTDDEMPSSDFTAVVTLMPDHELPITDIPNMINPIPEPEHANIKDTEVTDHSVPHLTPDPELIVTDPSSVISPITETEHTKLRDTETADYRVKISDAAKVFTLIPVGELPATDTPNVNSPIPESEHVKIRDTEVTDHEPSTIETTKSSNPSHAYSTREKNLTDHKLPTSGTSHVSIPTLVSDHIEDKAFTDHELTNSDTSNAFSQAPISENSDTEDQEFKAPKATNSETSHLFSSTPRSELDNKEDKEMKDHKLPIQGTPNVFSQSQKSAHDNTEVEDLADYGLSSSDTPNVFQSAPVSPLGSTEEKDLSALAESDSPSDNSPIIATNPIPETDAKVDQTEPETLSTVDQFPSTNYAKTPGPYVKYMSKEKIPCSITESLKHFSEENITNEKALTAPRYPPSNLTLVTVEGCSSFLIVDWKSNKNDTASEYEVVSEMQGPDNKTEKLITLTNQTHAAVENLKPNTSYTFSVTPTNVHGRGPSSDPLPFVTESADPSVSEYIPGKDAIWTQYSFKFDSYSECQGKRFVKRTRYRKFVGIVLCNSLRYKIYLSNSLSGVFYNIGDLSGHGEDHCQFVDSFLDGRTGEQLLPEQLPIRQGFYRSVRQEPVMFGTIGGQTHINYVHWYECGISIPGQW
ncbi:target of Nesh-SH3-like isoform X3 [Narcine bancroftii]|uniref:target of Nesh-SH3-like isoform X3 n=1 Tax=Narcine bancroftii TaxID=1343680 RepID=UPI003831F982